jgi:L-serine dehydratase
MSFNYVSQLKIYRSAKGSTMISILDLFRIGVGPSSSHTVGPMRIARRFVSTLDQQSKLSLVSRVHVQLQGSLALTGVGHGSPMASVLGLLGAEPQTIDPDTVEKILAEPKAGTLRLLGKHSIKFDMMNDIELACHVTPRLHPNGMRIRAYGTDGLIADETYFSTGGGFIATLEQIESSTQGDLVKGNAAVTYPFSSGAQLLASCKNASLDIASLILVNEEAWRSPNKTNEGIDALVSAMLSCIDRGLRSEGELPGGLHVRRRAPGLWRKLEESKRPNESEALLDWLNVFAMAVNEENASGGRVVTAPTNGAAGIIPALIRHYCTGQERAPEMARRFILTAGGIGLLYKQRASISGAEMGCQGEVGVACSMAAAGLAAVWGGTPEQVASAAEIGMEHNLGLTCDPVGGLVQIPCIERNAIGAVKAVNAARLALHSHETPKVSLDQVIETMRQTGLDMSSKYKETSLGGLAVNVVAC